MRDFQNPPVDFDLLGINGEDFFELAYRLVGQVVPVKQIAVLERLFDHRGFFRARHGSHDLALCDWFHFDIRRKRQVRAPKLDRTRKCRNLLPGFLKNPIEQRLVIFVFGFAAN